jgi:hypothetical protein
MTKEHVQPMIWESKKKEISITYYIFIQNSSRKNLFYIINKINTKRDFLHDHWRHLFTTDWELNENSSSFFFLRCWIVNKHEMWGMSHIIEMIRLIRINNVINRKNISIVQVFDGFLDRVWHLAILSWLLSLNLTSEKNTRRMWGTNIRSMQFKTF